MDTKSPPGTGSMHVLRYGHQYVVLVVIQITVHGTGSILVGYL